MKRILLAILTAIAAAPADALAVPGTLTFTGRVSDQNGPIDGSVNLIIQLYDAATDGTLLWEELHTGLTADQGLVYVELGSQDPLDGSVFDGSPRYLQVIVNSAPVSPRLAIGTAPYAVRAAAADRLGTLSPADVALSTHSHTGYASTTHDHAGTYAALAHDHGSSYASLSHHHDGNYALLVHNHDASYATLAHAHSDYALGTHDHDVAYAALSHSHSYAALTHSHGSADIDAYQDLSSSGVLDNNAASDILVRSQGDTRYALSAHAHSGYVPLTSGNAVVPGDYTYSTTKTGYVNIMGAAFAPDRGAPSQHGVVGGAVYPGGSSTTFGGTSSLSLPPGAVVTNLRLYYYDVDPGGTALFRCRLITNDGTMDIPTYLAQTEATSSGATPAVQFADVTPAFHTVVAGNQYALELYVEVQSGFAGPDMRHYGCQLTYTYTTLNR